MAINFLPWREIVYKKNRRVFSRILLIILILSMVIFWAIHAQISQKKNQIYLSHQQLLKKIQHFHQKNKIQQKMLRGDKKNNEQLKWVFQIIKKRKIPLLFLEKLSEANFKELYLTQLNFENERLNLKGITTSISSVFGFVKHLKAWSMVGEVCFLGVDKTQEINGRAFSLEVTFKKEVG